MSLQSPLGYQLPDETAYIARAAFPNGNLYIEMQAQLGMIYSNPQFASLFSLTGQPALDPARLALILVMQALEGLPDRQTADAVRARIDWKYALALELTDPGFDASVLSEFRKRLVTDAPELLLLDTLLQLLQARGLLAARGKQRTDATHILASVRTINRLALVLETMRLALNRLATLAPEWLWPQLQPDWLERYELRAEHSRLPSDETKRAALVSQVGADGFALLAALFAPDTPHEVRQAPAVEVLRQVWLQQYYGPHELRWRGEADAPAPGQLIHSPYDVEARYSSKRDVSWVGYKVHYTETCDEARPHLITSVVTTAASIADDTVLPVIQTALSAKGLLPSEHLVDCGYTDAEKVLTSQSTHAVRLIGPVARDPSWQARAGAGYAKANFSVDWAQQVGTCPQGKRSVGWCAQADGTTQVRFAARECRECEVRAACTKAKSGPRVITLLERAQEELQQRLRQEQESEAFRAEYRLRAGVEGLLSQGVRAYELRKARYVGCAKTHLQHILIAVAINLVRLVAWWREGHTTPPRISAFARLATLA